jgi:hypothetical protein
MSESLIRKQEQNQAERAHPAAAKISQAGGAELLFAYCGLVNNA